MVTILGAGGAIGSELVKELTARNESIRLVSRNPECSGVRQIGRGRESELACQRFCEALVHLHVGRRAESGSAGGERKRLESNMARSCCSRSADRETVH